MTTLLDDLSAALQTPNMAAFLRLIRAGETSQTDAAYRTVVGGGLFDSFDAHPNQRVFIPALNVWSTAAGAYQFLSRTWAECATALDLPDFSPVMQDLAAAYLIKRRGALQDVLDGRVQQAIAKCAREWASLPGSPYGQPTRTMEQALATFAEFGGRAADGAPPVREPGVKTMPIPAILGALLPTVLEAIPRLGKIFSSGSQVAERNVKAAEVVFETIKQATGAKNDQEAVEIIKTDPVAREDAAKAIEARWVELTEGGGGGVDGARKADVAAMASGKPWQSPSFIVVILLVPLVYILVLSLIGVLGIVTWSENVRAGLAGSIISSIIGAVVGYYFGQTTSRNRTPAAGGTP